MNQQALIEKMAEALFDYAASADDECGVWEDCKRKDAYRGYARAALTAYAEATGERVVWTNNTSNDMAICRMNRNGEAFGPVTLIKHGYELVERKVGG